TSLHRAAVGPFTDKDAISLAALEAAEAGPERDALIAPVALGLAGLPEIRLDAGQAGAVSHGNTILLTGAGAPVALEECWTSLKGRVRATGAVDDGRCKPGRVFKLGSPGAAC